MNINSDDIEEKKKRGRKKKSIDDKNMDKNIEELQIEQVKKKRGRKKKWEVETTTKIIDNNPISFNENNNKYNDIIETDTKSYEQTNILFGNLNIKVHSNKENVQISDIKDTLIKNSKVNNVLSSKDYCRINLTASDFEDSDTDENINKKKYIVEKNVKIMKYFSDEFSNGHEILMSPYRCYNCHHHFNNKPFFLPINYNDELKRFKVTGNFCSPNCVKSYALNNNFSGSKLYLIGYMYRKLFGAKYIIKPAPPIQTLKEYGGFLTIEKYRENFDNNKIYNLKNICSKIITDEIIN
tara:strand:+ start:7508 stop:8395 length:888 start_codon:yes stop_codon:yes gene_type:complete